MKKLCLCVIAIFISISYAKAGNLAVNVGNAVLDGDPAGELYETDIIGDGTGTVTLNNNTILGAGSGVNVDVITNVNHNLTVNNVNGNINVNNSGNISLTGAAGKILTLNNSGNITVGGDISATDDNDLILTNTRGVIVATNIGSNITSTATAYTLNGGSLAATDLTLYNAQTFTFNGGTFSGNLNGYTNVGGFVFNSGEVVFDADTTLAVGTKIGSKGVATTISSVTVQNNANVVANEMIRAASINISSGSLTMIGANVSGAVSLNAGSLILQSGATVSNITIAASAGATLNLGEASSIGGTFIVNTGNTIATTIAATNSSNATIGNYGSSGTITVAANTSLKLTLTSATARYLANGQSLTLAESVADSTINVIADSDIDVNSSGSNTLGLLTFTTSKTSKKLMVDVAIASVTSVVSDSSLQNAFGAIDPTLVGATGGLATIQEYIFATSGVSNAQRAEVLEAIAPNSVGLNQNAFATVQSSVDAIENRIGSVRTASAHLGYKTVDKNGNKVKGLNSSSTAKSKYGATTDAAIDDDSRNKSLWAQTIITSAEQKNKGRFSGYNSSLFGLTIGADQKIDKDAILGISFTVADSKIKSTNSPKTTDVDSYQAGLYGEKMFGQKYYVDGFLGAALNKYSSSRYIPVANLVANSKYDGQTYSAKVKTGMINKFKNGFRISPELGLFYAYNNINSYEEFGANTLNLAIEKTTSEMLEGSIGVNLSHEGIEFKNIAIAPKLNLNYGYDFIGNTQISRANFVGQTTSFDTQSSEVNRQTIRVAPSFDFGISESLAISATYLLEAKKTYRAHSGIFKLKYAF